MRNALSGNRGGSSGSGSGGGGSDLINSFRYGGLFNEKNGHDASKPTVTVAGSGPGGMLFQLMHFIAILRNIHVVLLQATQHKHQLILLKRLSANNQMVTHLKIKIQLKTFVITTTTMQHHNHNRHKHQDHMDGVLVNTKFKRTTKKSINRQSQHVISCLRLNN